MPSRNTRTDVVVIGAGLAAALAFTREIPARREAASRVAMGHVQRISVLLDRPLVELLGDRRKAQLADAAFVGGSDAAETLLRPVRRTGFFAGEATEAGGRTATLHGAVATGFRAAAQVERAFARREGTFRHQGGIFEAPGLLANSDASQPRPLGAGIQDDGAYAR